MGISSKKLKKELGKLAEKAYEIALDSELSKLSSKFDEWKNQKMDGFELTEEIHEFHDGISRELWKRYNGNDTIFIVSHAVVQGILDESEISDQIMHELKPIIESLRKTKW